MLIDKLMKNINYKIPKSEEMLNGILKWNYPWYFLLLNRKYIFLKIKIKLYLHFVENLISFYLPEYNTEDTF